MLCLEPTTDHTSEHDFRRTIYRRQNMTITRTAGGRGQPSETVREHSSTRVSSNELGPPVDPDPFGPVRVTDTELRPLPERPRAPTSAGAGFNAPTTGVGGQTTSHTSTGYVYRRYNATTSTGTRYPTVGGGQSPILWYNRTWHWSTNRTRDEYDPDLDGTTTPRPMPTFDSQYLHPWGR